MRSLSEQERQSVKGIARNCTILAATTARPRGTKPFNTSTSDRQATIAADLVLPF
jgi:hypothetical protein